MGLGRRRDDGGGDGGGGDGGGAAVSGPGFVCVKCGADAPHLYQTFGGVSNIRLSLCQTCNGVVDPYVEYELMLVVLDLILHKTEAYRHLLFNRGGGGVPLSAALRFVPVYLVLDAYVKWSRVPPGGGGGGGGGALEAQLAALWLLALAETAVFALAAVAFAAAFGAWRPRASAASVARAVTLSSFGKLFVVLSMVWEYEAGFATAIHLFVLTSNLTALVALLDAEAARVAAAVLAAWAAKTCFSWAAAAAAGLPPGAASVS